MPVYLKSANVIKGFFLVALLLTICVLSSSHLDIIKGLNFSNSASFFISRLLFWLSLGVIYLYVTKIENQPLLLWGEKDYKTGFYLLSIFLILLSVYAAAIIVGILVHYSGLNVHSDAVNMMYSFGIPLKLLIVLTAAVVEEVIFRGYLMPRLQLFLTGKYWPIIISALIFGVAHFRYGTIINIAIPVLLGFIFAWHYQKYRNLKILIICHFIIDFSSLILAHK